MFEMALFNQDGELVVCREFDDDQLMGAKVAMAMAEENEEYDHGQLINTETGKMVCEFGYVGAEMLDDEVGFNPFVGCFDFDC